MKTSQKGFSVVEILIVVVVVGLLAAGGWLVYDRQKNKTNEEANNARVEETKKGSETPKLQEYKNDELGLSLSYPAAWGTANLTDGRFLQAQSGSYKQLSFSNATAVSINFVTGPYSSPLDACGHDDAVLNAQHHQNANQAALIGWEGDSVKLYERRVHSTDGPTIYTQSRIDDSGTRYTEVSRNDKVLVYKDVNNYPVKAGGLDENCFPITQAQADEANAFENFFHYAVNYSNNKVFGVNGQFDARKGDDAAVRSQLTDTLNNIK